LAVGETAEQSDRYLACRIVKAKRRTPDEVVELGLQQLFDDPGGGFIHVHVSPAADPAGAVVELVGIGFSK
jgi:hypothetical protein